MTNRATTLSGDPWETRTVTIVDVVKEADGVATYRMRFKPDLEATAYAFTPGQFNMLYLPGVGESAISMSGDPAKVDGWIHTVRVAGNVTRSLSNLTIGETLGIRGPFGTGWPINELSGRDVVIVAGGLGIAPLRPLIYHVINHRHEFENVRLIVGSRSPDSLLFQNEFDEWRNHRIQLDVTVDQANTDWRGHIGVVTLLTDRLLLPNPHRTAMVTCGPEVMMKYAAASCRRRGIPEDQIWVSLERNMQCAAGLCGHCQLGPAFICKDGPVLRYDRIRPLLFVEQL